MPSLIHIEIGNNSTVDVTIDRRYDVPYLAGASNDGKTVYIDRRVPRKLAVKRKNARGYVSITPDQFLATHETIEHLLMVHQKMPYLKAHAIATDAEKAAVERAGVDWDNYEKVMGGLLAHIEHEKPRRAPPDLYTKPYPHDKAELLKKLAIRSRAEGGPLDADPNAPPPNQDADPWESVPRDSSGRPIIYIGGGKTDLNQTAPAGGNTPQNTPVNPPSAVFAQSPRQPPSPSGPGGPQNIQPDQSVPPLGPPSPINAQGGVPTDAPASDTDPIDAGAPSPAPGEPEPVPHTRSILDKLLGIGGPRYELWPERLVRSALTAPGEVAATGQLTERDPYGRVIGTEPEMSAGPISTDVPAYPPGFPSESAIQRSQDIAAMQFSGGAGAAEEGALGSAGGKTSMPDRYLLPAIKYGDKIYKGQLGQEHLDILPDEVWNDAGISPDSDIDDIINELDNLPGFRTGFVNHKGQFLDHGKASTYAVNNGLIKDPELAQYLRESPSILTADMLKTEAGKPGAAIAAAERSPFYSAAEQTIANAKQSKMTPDQWIGWLRNQPGIKPEELQWTGLGDKTQLPEELQNGSITKDQLLAHVKENQVQPQLVEKSGEPAMSEVDEDRLAEQVQAQLEEEFTRRYPFGSGDDFTNWKHSEEGVAEWERIAGELTTGNSDGPRYPDYQLPGGDNYRETLLTLPPRQKPTAQEFYQQRFNHHVRLTEDVQDARRAANADVETAQQQGRLAAAGVNYIGGLESGLADRNTANFNSSHWDEPNVLLHMRMNDRDIPGVGKDLHLEELQSDWHQKGRRQGYQGQSISLKQQLKEAQAEGDEEAEHRIQQQLMEGGHEGGEIGVPDAPFKTTWPDLGLKTAITKAAREGYDSISWTPGEQQAERYDLSKHFQKIEAIRLQDGTYRLDGVDNNGTSHNFATGLSADKVADYVGKDLADKIVNNPKQTPNAVVPYSGVDLKVGGEGMKGFYDKMLVDKANALGKKFGAKVQWKDLGVGVKGNPLRQSPTGEITGGIKVPVLRLTPQLKEQALKGMPLFTEAGRPAAAIAGLRRPLDTDAIDRQLASNPGSSIFDVSGHPEMNPPASVAAPTIMKGAGSPLGIRSPQIRQLFDNVIGAYMPEKEFADKYLMGMADPETTVIMPSEHFDGAGISITSSLVDPKTNTHLGSVERHIVPGEAAYHSALEVYPKAPPGFTKQMLQNQIDLYNKMGVRYVDLYANVSVGGYAWAKYGWVPDTQSWNSVRTGRYGIPGRLQRLWGQEGVDPKVLAAIPKIAANPDPKSIWDIADINAPVPRGLVKGEGRADQFMTYTHPSTKTIGQYLLKGMGWDGRLNLNDPESMGRFNTYIGRGGTLPSGGKP